MNNLIKDSLILIPARGGSKGLPRKNIIPLNGKPLIFYTLEIAKKVVDLKNICVSTDDIEIAKAVEKYGVKVPFMRPSELSTDVTSSEAVIKHALDFYKNEKNINYKKIILLQPTSPFRKKEHLTDADSLWSSDTDMIVSVVKTKANPYFSLYEENKNGFLQRSKASDYERRQGIPDVWQLNGSIYIINVDSFNVKGMRKFDKIIKYPMDKIYSVDIDDVLDLKWAENLLNLNLL
ncbi:cytidylyltransferase domain-containing protein [Bacteroidota bacterium]